MKSIQFFMLVTNRDAYIASYAIKSYNLVVSVLKNYDWKLTVYLNCIKQNFKDTIVNDWRKYNYVEIIDNEMFVNKNNFIPGTSYSKDGGYVYITANAEPYDEIWTREFRNFKTDYWVTVDADFEILKPDFIVSAFKMLENDNNLAVISSDFSENTYTFDSYSKEYILAMKRYHTWFCIYKNISKICNTPHYYYKEEYYGVRLSFDSACKFQYDLRDKYGYSMKAVDKKYYSSYIHYGQFSNNSSLDTLKKINRYRKTAILAYKGIFGNNWIIDKIIKKIFLYIHNYLYKNFKKELGKYNYNSELDK